MADSLVLQRLESLVSPFGVIADACPVPMPRGLSGVFTYAAFAGSGSPGREIHGADGLKGAVLASGHAFDDADHARLVAIAEGAERYSAGDFLGEPAVWAAYRDLDGPALDIDRIPRCSARELATPGCPLEPLDPGAPLRWVRGVDLAGGAVTWVPAVMACYGLRDLAQSERFWYRISTGFAVHTDPAEAVVRGIMEVIERDAIAVSWLQKLTLPVIAARHVSDEAGRLVDWARRHFIDCHLFDATTDMAVPTVCCLQIAPHDPRLAHVMGWAASRSIESAAERVLLETIPGRLLHRRDGVAPEALRDMTSIGDSARYMADPARAEAFGFLLEGAGEPEAPGREPLPEGSAAALAWLVAGLSRKGMQVIAVDRTTRELAEAGLTSVSVVIPDLQPMSLLPLAQYRAHLRLYSAPRAMGYPSLTEEELNSWPLPYA